jgi:heme/copper-type cytochrome/quinol oxidase subunit 3
MCIWFIAAVVSTISNKQLVMTFDFPIFLTVVHLASAWIFDWAMLKAVRKAKSTRIRKDLLLATMPIGIMLALGKMLTYISYEHIPASLTHTVKVKNKIKFNF